MRAWGVLFYYKEEPPNELQLFDELQQNVAPRPVQQAWKSLTVLVWICRTAGTKVSIQAWVRVEEMSIHVCPGIYDARKQGSVCLTLRLLS